MIHLMTDSAGRVGEDSKFKTSEYHRTSIRIRPDLHALLQELENRIGLGYQKQINKAIDFWFRSGCPVQNGAKESD